VQRVKQGPRAIEISPTEQRVARHPGGGRRTRPTGQRQQIGDMVALPCGCQRRVVVLFSVSMLGGMVAVNDPRFGVVSTSPCSEHRSTSPAGQ
jgi:hypothetical protein